MPLTQRWTLTRYLIEQRTETALRDGLARDGKAGCKLGRGRRTPGRERLDHEAATGIGEC